MFYVIRQPGTEADINGYKNLSSLLFDYPPTDYRYLENASDEEIAYWGEHTILVIEGSVWKP